MGIGMASVRLARLNDLMHHFLSHRQATGKELLERIGYSSQRMLQRDISYLRSEYNVDITYDFSKHIYICRDSGHFIIHFSLSREETIQLATGLSLFAATMEKPSLADNLWNKLRPFIPEDIAAINECGLPDINLLLSGKKLKKYRRYMDLINSSLTLGG